MFRLFKKRKANEDSVKLMLNILQNILNHSKDYINKYGDNVAVWPTSGVIAFMVKLRNIVNKQKEF